MSFSLAKELEEYIKSYGPKSWLFEGKVEGTQYSKDAIQRAFKKTLQKAGITKSATPQTLKYSCVHHLETQGIPLRSILKELKMASSYSSRTYIFYSQILRGQYLIKVEHSPLDRILRSNEQEMDTKPLQRLLLGIKDEDEKEYLSEAVKCFRFGIYRAGVIFAWSAAIRNIHERCLKHSKHSLNSAVKKFAPKSREIKKIEDFAYIKDSAVLLVAQQLGEFDKNERDILVACLDLRNKCGHPGKYKPKPYKVAAFIEDMISILFRK